MIDLYKNIRALREQRKMSQEELAKLTGYTSRSSIAKIEKGEVDLPLSKIELFADALGTSPGELMGDTWESDVLDNARLDIIDHFNGDAFKIAKFQEAERNDILDETNQTIAAHKEDENFTPEELQKIEEYKKLLIAARPKD